MAINRVDSVTEQFLAALDSMRTREGRAQEQITSGYRINSVSDEPNQIDDVLQTQVELSRVQQISTNLSRVKAEADAAENVLESAVKLLDGVLTAGVDAAGTIDAALERPPLAARIRDLFVQLVDLSRTTVEGRFIFSGDADGQASYQVNLANPNGVDRLSNASATRLVEDPNGSSFGVARTAQDIFDHRNADDSLASDNVFAAINALRVALENNQQSGIDSSLASLRAASAYLNQQLAFYGNVQNRLASAMDAAAKFQVRWKVRLSQLRDTDLAAAVSELNLLQTHEQAAIKAEAQRPRTSLFDYL